MAEPGRPGPQRAPARPIARVLVLGSGVMGRGIAAVFAKAGFPTAIYRPTPKPGLKLPEGVRLTLTMEGEAADLVIESVYEVLETKIAVLRQAEAAFGADAVLASNTSGLPLDDIAAGLDRPERFLGMHYFMPAEVSPLVEVVRGARTADWAMEATIAALARAGREALVLNKPVVGYLWNRLQHAILHEAYWLIENGVVDAAAIDKVAKKLFGPRFCTTGLVESKDIGGLKMHIQAQHSIVPHLNLSRTPCAILDRMMAAEQFGTRTGQGFYDWGGRDPDAIAAAARRKLEKLNAFLASDLSDDPATQPTRALAPDEIGR